MSAGLAGCAAGVYLPPGSRPAAGIRLYHSPDFTRILPGRWQIRVLHRGQQNVETEPNIFRRYAQIAGIRQWQTLDFLPSGDVLLQAPGHSMRLDYHVEGNELRLGPIGPHIEHDDWELAWMHGELYVRSLVDAETLAFIRQRGPAATASGDKKKN